MSAQSVFGHAVASDFMFADGFKNLNHGEATCPRFCLVLYRYFMQDLSAHTRSRLDPFCATSKIKLKLGQTSSCDMFLNLC